MDFKKSSDRSKKLLNEYIRMGGFPIVALGNFDEHSAYQIVEVVYNYLGWLEKAFVIYRCQCYDLQGKSVLKTQEKFYLADANISKNIYAKKAY